MNIMISAVGLANPLPTGSGAEGLLFVVFLTAAGLLLITGAGRLLRRHPHRRHAVRYSGHR